jgi:16S rRNA C967 or C1407 C5-methylase (RsmB/RsmF family)/NOL1/NOP2/fmu family ribosome biogenesis protein
MAEIHFPELFATRMKRQLLEQWPGFQQAHASPSLTSIRINPFKNQPGIPPGEAVPWCSTGFYLKERPSFTHDPVFHGGAYYVQEASSMFLEQAFKQGVEPNTALRVLDLCAAPGGKSTHLLSMLNKDSLLVSNEVIRTRATVLSENIEKWGNPNVVVTNNDPQDFGILEGFFDVIVVDAPCSGEGLFRKDPDAMAEWSEENAQLCSLRQRRILNEVWPALKQNGILIYSTCTYNPEENQTNLLSLLKEKSAECIRLSVEKSWGIMEVTEGNVIGYQCYPHQVKGEGFFISVIRKTEEQHEYSVSTKPLFQWVPKKIVDTLRAWTTSTETDFIIQDDLILALPTALRDEMELLNKRLKVIQKGTAVARLKHDKLVPEHAWALSQEINREHFTTIELTTEQALAYLRKDVFPLDQPAKGFALFTYHGVAIGWANLLGNRFNNLYPSNWRILK